MTTAIAPTTNNTNSWRGEALNTTPAFPLVEPVAVGLLSVLVTVRVLVWRKELDTEDGRPSTVYTRT